jgi:hypothetical protein
MTSPDLCPSRFGEAAWRRYLPGRYTKVQVLLRARTPDSPEIIIELGLCSED